MRLAYHPSDSAIVVRLPDQWVQDHNDTILNTEFDALFHGFEIRPVSNTAIVGFSALTTEMVVGNSVDTLAFVPERLFTHLIETVEVETPLGVLPVIDGFGTGLQMAFDLTDEDLTNAVLSRVTIRIPTAPDILAPDSTSGFVRPLLQQLYLWAIDTDGVRLFLQTQAINADSQFEFVGSVISDSHTFLSVIQDAVHKKAAIDHFVVSAPPALMTIAPVFVPTAGLDNVPEAILTFVPGGE